VVAFLKLQGEPFEVYVTNFLLALVSPQRRVWSKEGEMPSYLKDLQSTPAQPSSTALKQTADKTRLAQEQVQDLEYIRQMQTAEPAISSDQPETKLDLIEQQYLEGKIPVTIGQSVPIPVPNPPTQLTTPSEIPLRTMTPPPGVIWGIVKNNLGKLLEGAIISIYDSTDKVVSSLRTNPLGQFRVGGQLPAGAYTVKVSAPGLNYEPAALTVNDQPLNAAVFIPTPASTAPVPSASSSHSVPLAPAKPSNVTTAGNIW
jgi:hypothetical protein